MICSDTIAAISTPNAVGGISMIRISGPDAADVAGRVFRPVSGKPLNLYKGCLLYTSRCV